MEESAKLKNFLDWATLNGISDYPFIEVNKHKPQNTNVSQTSSSSSSCLGHSLSISHFPNAGGRGLCAVRDIGKGEIILRVPKSALMTSQSLILNDVKLSMCVSKSNLSSTQILAVALLNEVAKGKQSRWYPYLTQFPTSYDILASFDRFEIQTLQLDDAIWAAEKALEKTKVEWKDACPIMEELMFKPHYMSFKAWIWASASISSRTMHVPWDAAGCFCPVGDFFNYAAPGEEQVPSEDLTAADTDAKSLRLTDGVFEEKYSAYCFYARRNYKKGDQVLLSYGTYTNLELLEHYDSLYIHQNGKPSFALLAAMRLWATPIHLQRSARQLAYSGSSISNTNEIIVMEWLVKKCCLVMENLPTSIEEDKSLLSVLDKEYETAMELKIALSDLTGETLAFLKVKRFSE